MLDNQDGDLKILHESQSESLLSLPAVIKCNQGLQAPNSTQVLGSDTRNVASFPRKVEQLTGTVPAPKNVAQQKGSCWKCLREYNVQATAELNVFVKLYCVKS